MSLIGHDLATHAYLVLTAELVLIWVSEQLAREWGLL